MLKPYLSIVISETTNYDKYTVDQPNLELDYKDDNKDDLENEHILMSPD